MGTDRVAALPGEPGHSSTEIHGARPFAVDPGTGDRQPLEPGQRHPSARQRKAAGVERVRGRRRKARDQNHRTVVTKVCAAAVPIATPPAFTLPQEPGLWQRLRAAVLKVASNWRAQQATNTLRVVQTATLGDKRMVAVVECDSQRFLIGASSQQVTLLSKLSKPVPRGKLAKAAQ